MNSTLDETQIKLTDLKNDVHNVNSKNHLTIIYQTFKISFLINKIQGE
jgi:hypothetical protein